MPPLLVLHNNCLLYTSIIARNGGDEFCIILKDCSAEEAAPMIDAFSKASRSFSAKGAEHNYSISLGYAEYPANAEKVSDILRYADIALYEVKLQGKHGALAYRPDFHNSKRTQLGFSLSDISDNLPGAFFIYRACLLYTSPLHPAHHVHRWKKPEAHAVHVPP